MKVYFASDHAGFQLKEALIPHVRSLGYEVKDVGPVALKPDDDYPSCVRPAIQAILKDMQVDLHSRAIILGGSGQGEAIVANRFHGIRAAVYYGIGGEQTDSEGRKINIIESVRLHNDTNVLSLGARFITEEEARVVVQLWLELPFSDEEKHKRRVKQIDEVT